MVATLNRIFIDPNVYTSAALETVSLVTGSVTRADGAGLVQLFADNQSATPGWFQVFDGYAAPTAGAVPKLSLRVAANSQVQLDAGSSNWLPCKTGIVVALSSTGPTYTAVATGQFVTAFWTTR